MNTTINGSIKGTDAFAIQHGFMHQRPLQSLQYFDIDENTIVDRTFIYCDK